MHLTVLQSEALQCMNDGLNVFLTGAGGTGKSFLIKEYLKHKNNESIYVTSTTGISSLIINGTTLHSYAGIGLGNKSADFYIDKIKKSSKIKKRWINTKVLIIDEISMLDPDLFDKLELIARTVRKNDKKFGGIQLILSGDFLQLPPVSSKKFCFESQTWSTVIDKIFYFTEIIRQDNKIFQSVLNKIRLGIVDDEVKTILSSCQNKNTDSMLIEPTHLYSKKDMVQKYNINKLNLLKQTHKPMIFTSTFEFQNIKEEFKEEYINMINKIVDIDDTIELTIDTQVMLTVNKPDHNLANGSVGKIINFEDGYPCIRFYNGVVETIKNHSWSLHDNTDVKSKEPNITKKQLPLILAWSITIHRAQGATLDCIYTDIGNSIFEYGQAYVTLSRVKSLEGLFIKNINFDKIQAHSKVIEFYKNYSESSDSYPLKLGSISGSEYSASEL